MGGREDTRTETTRESGRRVHARRFWRAILSALPGVVAYGIGSILDFLVEDACVLCGCLHRRPIGEPVDVDGPAGHLLEPVRSPWARGRVTITNHPVCVDCARGFDAAETVGVAGMVIRPGTIETASGERFGTADSTVAEGARCAQPDCVTPVEKIHVVAPFMVNDNTLKIIHLMKFGGYEALARPIGRAIGHAARRFGVIARMPHVAVPVPMDAAAKARRGFNQAERIARELGTDLGITVSVDLLEKTKGTRRQSGTKRELRAANVRGVFACPRDVGGGPAGKHIFLVDDLVTTGATVAACAAALYGAGAESVTVLSFGRAL